MVNMLNEDRYTTHVTAVDYSFVMGQSPKTVSQNVIFTCFEMARTACRTILDLVLLTRLYQKQSLMESKYLCPDQADTM